MSNGFLYTSFHYLQQLSKDHVINEVLHQEYAKRKGAPDGATFESIAKEFTESNKELPHIKFDGHTTSLEVPKNTNCELFFTNKIDINIMRHGRKKLIRYQMQSIGCLWYLNHFLV